MCVWGGYWYRVFSTRAPEGRFMSYLGFVFGSILPQNIFLQIVWHFFFKPWFVILPHIFMWNNKHLKKKKNSTSCACLSSLLLHIPSLTFLSTFRSTLSLLEVFFPVVTSCSTYSGSQHPLLVTLSGLWTLWWYILANSIFKPRPEPAYGLAQNRHTFVQMKK